MRRPKANKPPKASSKAKVISSIRTINGDGSVSTQRTVSKPADIARRQLEVTLERRLLYQQSNASDRETLLREDLSREELFPSGSGQQDESPDSDVIMGDMSDYSDNDEEATGGMQRDMEEMRLAEDMYVEFDSVPVGRTHRVDARTRRDRTQRITEAWHGQMAKLVDAYLAYECNGAPTGEEEANYPAISIIDILENGKCTLYKREDQSINVCLARHGYIGTAPVYPSTAISFRTLKIYHTLAGRTPQLSILAFMQSLCDLHDVGYRADYHRHFSVAYDAYLEILRRVEERMKIQRGQDAKDWKLKNACVACTYTLKDEPKLKYSMLLAMDGNNSLKRVARKTFETDDDGKIISAQSVERQDDRTIDDGVFMSPEEVDVFAHEVKSRKSAGLLDASPVGGVEEALPCVDRWKNLASEEEKKMWGVFDETGVFVVACRHGCVFTYCNMVRSGELAKYPLALTKKILDTFGTSVLFGYDIGCGFTQTVQKSSLVGPVLKETGSRFCVGAFHGHAHARLCQLDWHPTHVEGAGLEDFETCERVFSSSNRIASASRHASRYHRQQLVVRQFDYWRDEKYRDSSKFMCNNYYQALQNIETMTLLLQRAVAELKIGKAVVMEGWRTEEKVYHIDLKAQASSEEDTLRLEYVRLLKTYNNAEVRYADISERWMGESENVLRTSSKERDRKHAEEETAHYMKAVHNLELKLKIHHRWQPDSDEFKSIEKKLEMQEYQTALNSLESLVVARLFELTKMNNSGTGYKLRQQIAHALQKRSKTIRTGVVRLNEAAARLQPPRPALDVQTVLNYVFLGEFDLLRDSQNQVQEKIWAKPSSREAMNIYYKLKRSREEIERLHVEIVRLRTFMRNEELELAEAVKDTAESDPCLAHQFKLRLRRLLSVNAIHRERLGKLLKDSRYTGPKGLGIREGREKFVNTEEEVGKDIGGLCEELEDSGDEDEIEDTEGNDAVFTTISTIAPLDV